MSKVKKYNLALLVRFVGELLDFIKDTVEE